MTQHCRLEALGFAVQQCDHAASGSCATDDCSALEGGSYKLGAAKIAITAPKFIDSFFVLPLTSVLQREDPLFVDVCRNEEIRPLDWVPSWQFVRRAAPPSRAPSLLSA